MELRAVFAGAAVSRTGDWIYIVTLLVYVFEVTHSTAWVAAASICRVAPALVLPRPAALVTAKLGPKRTLILSDSARAATMVGLSVVAAAEGPAGLAIGLAMLSTILGSPSVGARDSIVASVAGEDALAYARARTTTIEHIALIVGEAGAGLVLVLSTAAVGFGINAMTFVVSVVLTLRISQPILHETVRMTFRAMPQAARDVLAERGATTILVAVVVATIAYGQELVLSVLISNDLLGTGSGGVGFLKASVGIGGLAAAWWLGRTAFDRRIRTEFAVACALSGIPLSVIALVNVPILAYVMMFAVGAGNVALDVISIGLVRRSVRTDVAHHMFTVLDRVGVAAVVTGSLLAPVLVAVLGLQWTLIATGALLVLLWIPIEPALERLESIASDRARTLAPLVELMRTVPIFDGAPIHSLEAMASGATETSLSPGVVVVREGEPADSFYVVRAGTLDVIIGDRVINKLGPGDHFGEIGLIERMPRTATVVATSPCQLVQIDGADFLAALEREPALAGPLTESASARLARGPD